MAQREAWSDTEIAVAVSDYMHMLTQELLGQQYSKAKHRRALLEKLDDRSDAAVELKHQNISAVLCELGCIWIAGYKPRSNYQRALAVAVEAWINAHPDFDHASRAAVEQPAVVPSGIDFSRLLVDAPPTRSRAREPQSTYASPVSAASKRDYIARETRNSALGRAGERVVLEYEVRRLRAAGKKHLAERIEHVSETRGDGLGFDVLSFEETGKERFIEVKTTAFAKETPFFASQNEVAFAHAESDRFHLYRLFGFRKSPRLFTLQGQFELHCVLDPVSYICRFQ